ncbi:hypothetical protein F2Q69_00036640 [Brassica cretica]|uniref:Uncharacterized protein n=1 Tax=Brassica cretica TaxID=69181 RepID=A0A8S9SRQ3_BRACR|nr:hypothetical protein F2Q69_00036640 [Brassica cretica]
MDLDRQLGKCSTYGDIKLYSAIVCPAFRSGSTEMGNGEHASALDMSELRNVLQGFDRHDKGVPSLAKLCNRIGDNRDPLDMLPELQDYSYSTSAKSDFKLFS